MPLFGSCPVLSVLYRRLPAPVRSATVDELITLADSGGLDLSGLWIARRRERIVGAMLTQSIARWAAAFWLLEVERSWGSGVLASSLVRATLHWYQSQGVRLAQALVEPRSARALGVDLARGGLPYVTDLIYLRRSVSDPLPFRPERPGSDGLGLARSFGTTSPRRWSGPMREASLCRNSEGFEGWTTCWRGTRRREGSRAESLATGVPLRRLKFKVNLDFGLEPVAVLLLSGGGGEWTGGFLSC